METDYLIKGAIEIVSSTIARKWISSQVRQHIKRCRVPPQSLLLTSPYLLDYEDRNHNDPF